MMQPRAAALKVVDASLRLQLRLTSQFRTSMLPPYTSGYLVASYGVEGVVLSEIESDFRYALWVHV